MAAGSLSVGGSEKALEEDGISGWKVDPAALADVGSK